MDDQADDKRTGGERIHVRLEAIKAAITACHAGSTVPEIIRVAREFEKYLSE